MWHLCKLNSHYQFLKNEWFKFVSYVFYSSLDFYQESIKGSFGTKCWNKFSSFKKNRKLLQQRKQLLLGYKEMCNNNTRSSTLFFLKVETLETKHLWIAFLFVEIWIVLYWYNAGIETSSKLDNQTLNHSLFLGWNNLNKDSRLWIRVVNSKVRPP